MDTPLDSLDWTLLRSFLAVAETGSLSAAARALGSSQPTLGRQIRAIETSLGADLFRRHPKGFDLTETGLALVEPARAMRDAVRQIGLTAAGREQRLEGTVRITASEVVSFHHLPAIVAAIRAAEPQIEIEIVPSDDSRNLLYREADIAIRMYRPTQLDLVTKHLGDVTLSLFAADSYVARRGLPQSPQDLLDHDIVGYDASPQIIEGFRAAGLAVDRNFFKTRCDDQLVAWELVKAGAGLGFAQRGVGLAEPLVREVTLGLDLPSLPVWLTAHQAMRHTPRIRRVWEMLEEGLRPHVS